MRKLLCALIALTLSLSLLSVPAMADQEDLVRIDSEGGAIMYDHYDLEKAIPYALIPDGAIALRIATIDWGYCIAYGNYVGYVFEDDARYADPDHYFFELPTGENYSLNWNNTASQNITYVPEFPYEARRCAGNQKISTRSGPDNSYSGHGSIQMGHEVRVFYQTKNQGVEWAYIEFERDNKMYRVFTPLYRINVDGILPDETEDFVTATIANTHTPRLGPGKQYAAAKYSVPAFTQVKAYYQENGWLLYDYKADDGTMQRAWAEPGDWY